MDYEIYRLIHFAGIFTLFLAFGSLFAGKSTTKGAVMGHGIGLFLILLGGFGMQAKVKAAYIITHGAAWPTWLIIKIVIWVALGGALVLAKRRIIKGAGAWILIIALGMASAYLAYNKPSLGNKPAAAQNE
ncbi:MAG: hypothetical protein KJO79_03230 [Verrucomicrobiae bacterium]|nr:hypothetical protein [Verrucomicrobiae bacterium]NNJ86168.1 hypothetical protein [Akkermansiaceae bacterium]